MTKQSLEKLQKMGYLLTSSGRVFDIDTGKLLKKGEMSKREWCKFLKFLLKFALFEFFVVLMVFMVVDFSLRIAQ